MVTPADEEREFDRADAEADPVRDIVLAVAVCDRDNDEDDRDALLEVCSA